MIDLDKLYEEKPIFQFFSTHLSYPNETPFQTEGFSHVIHPSHPSFVDVKAYWEQMCHKSLQQIQMSYTALFDFQKDATLFMTYVKYEDSKERGQMLARLKLLYEMFGLNMPNGELSDYLPLMCEFIYAAEWKGDSRAQQSFSLLLAVLEDGTYHLMNALKKYESPYYYLIKGLRETCKACIVQQEVHVND